MSVLKSVILSAMLIAICSSQALKYDDNAIMRIKDLFEIEKNNTILVQTIDSIQKFQELHPDLVVEEFESVSKVRGQIVYTLGARTGNDHLVGHAARSQSWPTPQNVAIQLTYPSQGVGALVTYVYVVINQSTKLGRAYIARGGLHQHFITVVIEAYSTTFANYDCQIYGI